MFSCLIRKSSRDPESGVFHRNKMLTYTDRVAHRKKEWKIEIIHLLMLVLFYSSAPWMDGCLVGWMDGYTYIFVLQFPMFVALCICCVYSLLTLDFIQFVFFFFSIHSSSTWSFLFFFLYLCLEFDFFLSFIHSPVCSSRFYLIFS